MNLPSDYPGQIRTQDLLGLSLSALRQQKGRTLLTLAGVVIGTFTLVVSLAIGQGVDRAIVALFHEDDRLRKIEVNPIYVADPSEIPAAEREPDGALSDASRARIRKALLRRWDRNHRLQPKLRLTTENIEKLGRLEHVETIEPVVTFQAHAVLHGKREEAMAISLSARSRLLVPRLVAGGMITQEAPRGALIHEFLLYRLGVRGDEEVRSIIGSSIILEYHERGQDSLGLLGVMARYHLSMGQQDMEKLSRALKNLISLIRFLPIRRDDREILLKVFDPVSVVEKTGSHKIDSETFTIIGVVREFMEGDEEPPPGTAWLTRDADVFVPTETAIAMSLRVPEVAREGFSTVAITVDEENNVKKTAKKIRDLGYTEYSMGPFVETIRMNILMITLATAFVSVVALLVAALGITNIMIMSVLERTHEIGIMKALGSRDHYILLIFLVEGALLGLVGGLLGLLLGWLASFPGDLIARSIMEPQIQRPVKASLFLYPFWLILGAPALACLITTLAAVYPAHRATSVDPITSLRHE